jgi:ubiquinone/menaquinone biosynthesis C-methylase UbiE
VAFASADLEAGLTGAAVLNVWMGTMSEEDPRKQYWNDSYYRYWKSRVDEAGVGSSKVIEGDANTEGDEIYREFFERFGFNPGSVLEVGCAWGRMFPLYLEHGLRLSAVDISAAMVDAARESWLGHERIDSISESSAESLPFGDGTFDNLACIATFDATFQNRALREFLRVTRPGARIFFTGKHDHYHDDDTAALDAEAGARRKNHPNYFTDTLYMLALLKAQGHRVDALLCFPRRGDFAKADFVTGSPERFYEYLVVLTRGEACESFPEFSRAHSRTFLAASSNE